MTLGETLEFSSFAEKTLFGLVAVDIFLWHLDWIFLGVIPIPTDEAEERPRPGGLPHIRPFCGMTGLPRTGLSYYTLRQLNDSCSTLSDKRPCGMQISPPEWSSLNQTPMPAVNPIWISTNLLPNRRQTHRNLPHAWNCGLFEVTGPQCSSDRNRVKPLQLSFVFWQGCTGSSASAQPGQTVVWLNYHLSPERRS